MRIWFNHWFSTAYHLIQLMRQGFAEQMTVIGSNTNPNAVYRAVCDEWYPEEAVSSDRYVEFCLDFCQRHAVDVFVPRRGLASVVQNLGRFDAMGVRVMAERDAALVEMLEDKVATYRFFEQHLPQIIPPYRLADSIDLFKAACDDLSSFPGRLCYKLVSDEGAKTFRVIDDTIESIKALHEKPGTKVTRLAAEAILAGYDFSVAVIVMPYLNGADVSVDCLNTDRGRIMLPRFKVGRFNEVRPDPDILRLCSEIMDSLNPEMPVNIQFKMDRNSPYLLEINPRMSGGLQISCMAAGINLPALALAKLLGLEGQWHYPEPWTTSSVVNLETPVLVYDGQR